MRPFKSSFAQRIQDYLELKRAMGRRYQAVECELRRFDRYVTGLDAQPEAMTRELVHAWLAARPHVGPVTQRSRAGIIRQFCLYLVRIDPRTFVPDRTCSPATLPIFKAHVYAVEEVRALLRAVPDVVSARFTLQRETLRAIVLLCYSTGLRAGEVSRLDIRDVDLDAGTLFVRETKFFKSRIVPISHSLAAELTAYWDKRRRLAPTSPHAPFFVNRCRRAVRPRNLSAVFHELVKSAGVAVRPGGHGPRLHDLRHTFAVRRVLGWYREGADVTAKLPLLATYMGHGNVLSTQVYLTATAELLREANGRFERAYGSLVVARKENTDEVR